MKTKAPYDPARAKESCYLLTQYVDDLIAGTLCWEFFETSPLFASASDQMTRALYRLCFSHLIVTLSKWEELYKEYQKLFPADVLDVARKLKNELEAKGVRNFRNKVIGHIWDDEHKRPLTAEEIEIRLKRIVGKSPESFCLWINNPKRDVFPETVVAISRRIRDRIAEEE